MSARHRATRREPQPSSRPVRRAYSDRRSLLHASKLEAFVAWAMAHGYRHHTSPPKASFEVARLERIDPAGNHPHIIIYHKLTGQHLTLCQDGVDLVHRWLRDCREARHG